MEQKTLVVLISEKNSLYRGKEKTIWEEITLATFRDGFIIGAIFALVLELGIIKIVTPLDKLIVFILLVSGIATSVNKAFSRGSLISPPWDGAISGFGVILGIVSILQVYVFPYLATT